MTRIFTTSEVRSDRSTDYWVDALCQAYVPLACEPSRSFEGEFQGEIVHNCLATVEVSAVTSSAQDIIRTKSLISRSTDDCFIVSIQRSGVAAVVQNDRRADLTHGDFAIYDSTRPYSLLYPNGINQFILKIPRAQLAWQLPNLEALTATKVASESAAGHLLITMLEALHRDMERLDPISFDALSNGIVSILLAGLRSVGGKVKPVLSTVNAYQQARIKQHALNHLHDPSLSIQTLSSSLNTSVATLYRAFANEGQSISEWIWSQRLERCRRDLGDPTMSKQSVLQIAYRWGFSNPSHMCRTFKQAYGVTPTEFRTRVLPRG